MTARGPLPLVSPVLFAYFLTFMILAVMLNDIYCRVYSMLLRICFSSLEFKNMTGFVKEGAILEVTNKMPCVAMEPQK